MRLLFLVLTLTAACSSNAKIEQKSMKDQIWELEAQIKTIDSTQQAISAKIIRRYDSIRSGLTYEQIQRSNISALQIQEIADSSMYLDPLKFYLQFQLSTLTARYDSIIRAGSFRR